MIDLVEISIDISHEPFGTAVRYVRKNSPFETGKNYSEEVRFYSGAAPVIVTSKKNGQSITIRSCPAKQRQGHNIFGSDQLKRLSFGLICDVLTHYQIQATPDQMNEWRRGKFLLQEVHITYQFGVECGSVVEKILAHLLRVAHLSLRPSWLEKGCGLRLYNSYSKAKWVLYDKELEFSDTRRGAKKALRPFIGEGKKSNEAYKLLQHAASEGIRTELKLDKKYLKRNNLDRASFWTPSVVKQIYLRELSLLRLDAAPSLTNATLTMQRLTDVKLRLTYFAWLNGGNLSELHSRQTLANRRRAILEKLNTDIMRDQPPTKKRSVCVAKVFDPNNILRTFPKWTEDFPKLAYRPKRSSPIASAIDATATSLPTKLQESLIKLVPSTRTQRHSTR